MRIDRSRLFHIESIAENARSAFITATARRDRVQGWLDAQRRQTPGDRRSRPFAVPPVLTDLSEESKRNALGVVAEANAGAAAAAEAASTAKAATVAKLEADLRAAAADVERAAQAQAQAAALAESCRKYAGVRHG